MNGIGGGGAKVIHENIGRIMKPTDASLFQSSCFQQEYLVTGLGSVITQVLLFWRFNMESPVRKMSRGEHRAVVIRVNDMIT
jgi:hypothetical protein